MADHIDCEQPVGRRAGKLGIIISTAVLLSLIVYGVVTTTGPRQDATKDIVVATRHLPLGITIKPSDVRLGRISPDQFPKGAFSTVEDVVDRPVTSSILPDEPVLEGRLAARGSGLGLAPVIPPGMRAVVVRVTDVAGVAGFVLPGMRVDVLLTGPRPGGDASVTTTALQNILVLSAGPSSQPDARGTAVQTPTVTLLATPEQAKTLALASDADQIRLVLRNLSDPEYDPPKPRPTRLPSQPRRIPNEPDLEAAFAIVDRAVQQLKIGNIVFTTPRVMNVKDNVELQLVLGVSAGNRAQEVVTLRGQITADGVTEDAQVRVAELMEAQLTGPDFQITATTPERQAVARNDTTQWKWTVKPLSAGRHRLHLTLSAILSVKGSHVSKAIRTFDRSIDVQVTWGQRVTSFADRNWQWLWTVAIAPLIAWRWKQRRSGS